jgi:hypothetical protein
MKKLILLSFLILFTSYSCSPTINRPLFAKSDSSKFKSNRTVIFDNNGKIITNKKHYKPFHMITGFNKYGYISVGIILSLRIIFGNFPALL